MGSVILLRVGSQLKWHYICPSQLNCKWLTPLPVVWQSLSWWWQCGVRFDVFGLLEFGLFCSVWCTWIVGVWALLFCLMYLDCWSLGSFVLFEVLGLLEFELFCSFLFSLAYSDCWRLLCLSVSFSVSVCLSVSVSVSLSSSSSSSSSSS